MAHFTLACSIALTALAAIASPAAAAPELAKYDVRTGTYCTTETVTGSMIPRRVCATRQQWIESGATRGEVAIRRTAVTLASNR